MKTASSQVNGLSPYSQPSFADEIRTIDMKWIWAAALVVVLIESLESLVLNDRVALRSLDRRFEVAELSKARVV